MSDGRSLQRSEEPDPDRATLERVVEGDLAAFGLLVERHQDRLVGLCHRMLGNREAARDAAQEVFLKVFRKAGTYKPQGKVYTWLYRIAVNHCLNRVRRRKVVRFLRLESETDEAPRFDPRDPAADPEQELLTRRRWSRAREAIDALPASQKAVLVLAKFEGLSYREIAEVLELTVGAVESRLFRAMRRLEAEMEPSEDRKAG